MHGYSRGSGAGGPSLLPREQGTHRQGTVELTEANSFPVWPCSVLQCRVAPTRLWRPWKRAAGQEYLVESSDTFNLKKIMFKEI